MMFNSANREPMQDQTASPLTSPAIAAFSLALACVVLGAAIGLMSESLLDSEQAGKPMAFADALGGILVGGGLGLLASFYLARDLSARARWWSAGVAIVLAAGTLWSLTLTSN